MRWKISCFSSYFTQGLVEFPGNGTFYIKLSSLHSRRISSHLAGPQIGEKTIHSALKRSWTEMKAFSTHFRWRGGVLLHTRLNYIQHNTQAVVRSHFLHTHTYWQLIIMQQKMRWKTRVQPIDVPEANAYSVVATSKHIFTLFMIRCWRCVRQNFPFDWNTNVCFERTAVNSSSRRTDSLG